MVFKFDEGETPNYKKEFAVFDKDKNGLISFKDLSSFLLRINQNHTEQDLHIMMSLFDKQPQDKLSYEDIIEMVNQDDNIKDEELVEAFKMFDQDNDGYISFEEAKNGFKNIGEEMSDDDINHLIQNSDKDGQGKSINFTQFCVFMKEK